MRGQPVMDKVEVRVPSATQFSREFARVYGDLCTDRKVFHPSQFYIRVGDLRNIGYQSILHVHCQMDRHGNHKLELIDVGDLSFQGIQREILRVFEIEPVHLELMRLDLAADVPGVPVLWFARNARAKWKQWVAEIGKIEYARMGMRRVETVYFGKRPNCFRIYDKISELHHQYDKLIRKVSDGAETLSFEEKYGYPETGFVMTRVERQIAGGRLPSRIKKIAHLSRLSEFNPFDRLELSGGPHYEPNIAEYGMKYFTGTGLRSTADEIGLHRLRSLVNEVSAGNASRVFREYQAFLTSGIGIDEATLYHKYQESVGRQLAG